MKKFPIEVTTGARTTCISRKRRRVMYQRVGLDQQDTMVAWDNMAPLVFGVSGQKREEE